MEHSQQGMCDEPKLTPPNKVYIRIQSTNFLSGQHCESYHKLASGYVNNIRYLLAWLIYSYTQKSYDVSTCIYLEYMSFNVDRHLSKL